MLADGGWYVRRRWRPHGPSRDRSDDANLDANPDLFTAIRRSSLAQNEVISYLIQTAGNVGERYGSNS